jgi:hypothetical protein
MRFYMPTSRGATRIPGSGTLGGECDGNVNRDGRQAPLYADTPARHAARATDALPSSLEISSSALGLPQHPEGNANQL